MNKRLTLGILAHVDAGKTTLAEALLYTCGTIRKMGRVDHKDAFLDTFALERERGITIFSKQAMFTWEDMDITLLDTPGHVDFSAEMERTLQVLDAAVLVINGADGVQGHTRTLWRLLREYDIPTFLFVNKMDQPGTEQEVLLLELQKKLDSACVIFGNEETQLEQIAMCNEEMMEHFLETGSVPVDLMTKAVEGRQLFPCFFGSALKLQGVEELLNGIKALMPQIDYPTEFGARVFKITRDAQGNRLTYLKVTGGVLKAKQLVDNENSAQNGEDTWQEKVDQIRVYHGNQFQVLDEMPAGGVCAVTGLQSTKSGQGLGAEMQNFTPMLEPVLTYQILLPQGTDPVVAYAGLKRLEEEDPLLHLVWKEKTKEIHAMVMGEIQIEVLKRLILDRLSMEVEFGSGSIVYKETIAEAALGYGHFEPLRHYAEVQILLEPGEPGSGMQFASLCSEDMLDKNWQRLIMTHFEEKAHVGVLIGANITDMRISLIGGRAHAKHTEGGDFRQATYRAIRQGLRSTKSILLEPVFAFTLEVPTENLGRAMSDIQRMQGEFSTPVTEKDTSILIGKAPVSTMQGYQREVNSYTRGFGRFSCTPAGYVPCHNTEEVLAQYPYDPEADLDNPTGSVFCAHGAGFLVPWDQVPDYAHVESGFHLVKGENEQGGTGHVERNYMSANDGYLAEGYSAGNYTVRSKERGSVTSDYISQEEIDNIFRQTYGKKEDNQPRYKRYHKLHKEEQSALMGKNARPYVGKEKQASSMESYLLVDGYNIIFAWPELRELSKVNIDAARDKLMDIMSNYQGAIGSTLILVFDAYKVKGNPGSVIKYHNIHVVYTKEAETADQYIEKTVHEIGKKYRVTVATSDALEQMIIWGEGASRMSAMGLWEAVEETMKQLREDYGL